MDIHDADGFFADGNVSEATSGPFENGLSVHGELDIATLPVLERAFADPSYVSGCGPSREFALDLRALTFISLGCIPALERIYADVTTAAYRGIVAPSQSPGVRRMIGLAVLNGWLPGAFTFSPTEMASPRPTRLEGQELAGRA